MVVREGNYRVTNIAEGMQQGFGFEGASAREACDDILSEERETQREVSKAVQA